MTELSTFVRRLRLAPLAWLACCRHNFKVWIGPTLEAHAVAPVGKLWVVGDEEVDVSGSYAGIGTLNELC